MLHLKTAKLARWQIRLLCWSGGLLWTSGVVWLLLHKFGEVQGEFGPETNPAERKMLWPTGSQHLGESVTTHKPPLEVASALLGTGRSFI